MFRSRILVRTMTAAACAAVVTISCTERTPEVTEVAFSHGSVYPMGLHTYLCKEGTDATFELSNADVTDASLMDGDCAEVATHSGDASTLTVTITETSIPTNVVIDEVVIEDHLSSGELLSTSTASGPTVSVDMRDDHYYVVTYKNVDLSVNGRMTGGGNQIRVDDVRITRGLTVHCDITLSNNLEINWTGGNKWHLDKPITSAICLDDPAFDPVPPAAPFDTFIGEAVGRLNGVDGSWVRFVFVDNGEPGSTDRATINIWAPGDDPDVDTPVLSVSGEIDHGNLQAHYDQPHK